MRNDDQEREFRLKPARSRPNQSDEARVWSVAFKRIMHLAHMSSSNVGSVTPRRTQLSFRQRCAVRVTYSPNKSAGQWKAHGHYIERESATAHKDSPGNRGFGPSSENLGIPATLNKWQAADDPRLFKLIISPEFGDRLDLRKFTGDLMAEIQRDLGTRLEWIAAEHHNTEYPHVHVALRAVDEKGSPFRLEREYIQHGIRRNAENLATARLGYRTRSDAEEAQRREVHQKRYTSLDRMLSSMRSEATPGHSHSMVDLAKRNSEMERCILQRRLLFLEKMGLASCTGSNRWLLPPDFETILHAMQRTDDRQRSLASKAALVSDPRLPSRLTDLSSSQRLEGRVLGHREEESTGRTYMILEGTDRNIHFIFRTAELDVARRQGKLNPNSFVRLTTRLIDQHSTTAVQYFGDSEKLLSNKDYFRSVAHEFQNRGVIPSVTGAAGWLGKYEAKIADAAQMIAKEAKHPNLGRLGPSR